MRERVVQLARDLQALAHDGGVSGFLCQPLHLAGPHGHPAFELAAQRLQLAPLILKIAEDAGERARQLGDLIDPTGDVDALGRILSDGVDGLGQAPQSAGELPCPENPQQAGGHGETQGNPENLEGNRVRALIDALLGLG